MLATNRRPSAEEAYASVREMARKFEHLMHKPETARRQSAKKPPIPSKPTAAAARPKPPPKPPRRHPPQPAARQTSTVSATSAETIRSSDSGEPPTPEAELRVRSVDDDDNDDDDADDDLLYDSMIIDIRDYLAERESAAAENSDDTRADDVAESAHQQTAADSSAADTETPTTTDDSGDVIYQNIAAALADKQRNSSSTSALLSGQRVIQELLDNERSYIAALTAGIDHYIMAPEADADRPDAMVQEHIYGNVIVIRNFHENTFLPALACSGTDVERLCGCFGRFIGEGYFYSYIEYAINRKRSELLSQQHAAYYRRRGAECGDALGLDNFLIQPIQRLPKYQLLLYQLIRHLGTRLSNDDDDDDDATDLVDKSASFRRSVKTQIAACCRAEKHIQRLLDRLNAAMTIADIVDFHKHPEFLLLNIGDNGEFQLVQEFDIHDRAAKRRYRGKLFLFDKCVVFTELLAQRTLRFRGFYQQRHVGIAYAEGRNVFYLYHLRRGNQEIECEAPGEEVLHVWSEALGRMMLSGMGMVSWRRGGSKAVRNPKLSLG